MHNKQFIQSIDIFFLVGLFSVFSLYTMENNPEEYNLYVQQHTYEQILGCITHHDAILNYSEETLWRAAKYGYMKNDLDTLVLYKNTSERLLKHLFKNCMFPYPRLKKEDKFYPGWFSLGSQGKVFFRCMADEKCYRIIRLRDSFYKMYGKDNNRKEWCTKKDAQKFIYNNNITDIQFSDDYSTVRFLASNGKPCITVHKTYLEQLLQDIKVQE